MKVTLPAQSTLIDLANQALKQAGVEDASVYGASLAAAIEKTPSSYILQRTADSVSIEISPSQLEKFTGQVRGEHERSFQGLRKPSAESKVDTESSPSIKMPALDDLASLTQATKLLEKPSASVAREAAEVSTTGLTSTTFDALFQALAGTELTSRCEELGKGMNKRAYVLDANNPANKDLLAQGAGDWVILASRAGFEGMNWRAQGAEVGQLIALRNAGVLVPAIGFPSDGAGGVSNTVSDYMAEATERGEPCRFFLEQRIDGIETDKKNFRAFSGTVCDNIEGRDLPKSQRPKRSAQNAIKDIAGTDLSKIVSHLEKQEIPDFQTIFEPSSGHIYVIDPGDPELSNVREKHLGIAQHWQKHLPPPKTR